MNVQRSKITVLTRYHVVGSLMCILFQAMLTTTVGAQQQTPPTPTSQDASRSSSWRLRSQNDAVARALNILGLNEPAGYRPIADLVTLEQDNTPYLSDRLVGRALWHVVVRDWSIVRLETSPPTVKDRYKRTLDVFLDPTNGQVLKIKSRWPENEPASAPEPSAQSGARQMFNSGREVYHGFPSEPPPISFVEAIRAIQRGGGNPLVAKQIVGQWITWSRMDSKPRPMWAITLRGIPPRDASSPNVPVYFRDHMRYMVDPVEKRWVIGTVQPQPDIRPATGKEDG